MLTKKEALAAAKVADKCLPEHSYHWQFNGVL